MLTKLYLWYFNQILYPFVLGFWSENNGGGYCVTNRECTKFRWLGERKWSDWDNNPSYPRIFNEYLEVVTPRGINIDWKFFLFFLKKEKIDNPAQALFLSRLSKPYFFALHGDPQGQYHYCLTKNDPLPTTEKQKVAYIFPGTVFDLYDLLPEEELTWASPLVGGSLGWLAHLDSQKTIAGITAAKKRLS